MAIINLGILAHVDAGKTSLTERILFEAGVIRSLGSVDAGTTRTDTLDLERARGITIKSAVVSFRLHDRTVNLIDTPGHPDFIAEVERSLGVLDAVVLVISAVEGVQPQTRRLARAIRATRLPTIIFANKIDRVGARSDALVDEIGRKLGFHVAPLNVASGIGERTATVAKRDFADAGWRQRLIDLLAERSERVIDAFERHDGDLPESFLVSELRAQIATGDVVPLCFGSAMTGAGVPELLDAVACWLPAVEAGDDEPASGVIFKLDRRSSGEKIAYARLFAGGLAIRQHVVLRRRDRSGDLVEIDGRLTGIDRFAPGAVASVEAAGAGDIVGLHGLRSARIGDRIGGADMITDSAPTFPPPTLESVVRPVDPSQITCLRAALERLAEEDPLISLRQRDAAGNMSLRLYGEVQKEIVMETLARDYGVAVTCGPSETICIERPVGAGDHVETMFEHGNPFYATIGLHVAPGAVGGGIQFARELGSLPLAFYRAIEETVRETFAQGLCGWEVADCRVELTHAGFSSVLSTAGDFRKLTPLVLMHALHVAGTEVCEPMADLELDVPDDTSSAVCGAIVAARGSIRDARRDGGAQRLAAAIPMAELATVERRLPGLTRGEADWIATFAGYRPVSGEPPTRERIGPNPLNRAHYLAEAARV